MSARRILAAVLLGVSLSGCMTPEPPSGAENSLAVLARLVPTVGETENIDLFALREIYLAQNPDRFGMPLFQRQRRGFRLNPDGTSVRWGAFGAKGELFEVSSIVSFENGVICMDRTEDWSGACFSATFTPEGRIEVSYEYGNGHGGTFIAADL